MFGDEADGGVFEVEKEDEGDCEDGNPEEHKHDCFEVWDDEEPEHITEGPYAENRSYYYLVLLPLAFFDQLGDEYVGQIVGNADSC